MAHPRQFLLVKGFTPDRKSFVSYPALYILLSTSFLFAHALPLSTVLAGQEAKAQGGWAATYGGVGDDEAGSIQQTLDGGFVVAGSTSSGRTGSLDAGGWDLWVLKLGPGGAVEWQKTYGGTKGDGAHCIQLTSDGGYIVAGVTHSFGVKGRAAWVLKLKPDGAVEWQKTYGRMSWDEANSVQQTLDGGYIVAGVTQSFGAGKGDAWVLKLRPDGTVEWQKTYGGEAELDWARSIQQTGDGGYIVAGETRSFGVRGFDFDVWVLKLRSDGGVEWQEAYGGEFSDWACSVQQTTDGGYIVAGYTGSLGSFDHSSTNIWVLKLRPDGTVQWQKSYEGGMANSVQQTSDGGYVVAGFTDSMSAEDKQISDFWVLKLRPDGTVEWQKTYGGAGDERAESIQQTSDGGYIVAGKTESFGAGGEERPDLWVLKLSPDGSIGPSCDFIRDTSFPAKDTNAIIKATTVSPRDSNASPVDSPATVQATNVSANFQCQSTAVEGQHQQ